MARLLIVGTRATPPEVLHPRSAWRSILRSFVRLKIEKRLGLAGLWTGLVLTGLLWALREGLLLLRTWPGSIHPWAVARFHARFLRWWVLIGLTFLSLSVPAWPVQAQSSADLIDDAPYQMFLPVLMACYPPALAPHVDFIHLNGQTVQSVMLIHQPGIRLSRKRGRSRISGGLGRSCSLGRGHHLCPGFTHHPAAARRTGGVDQAGAAGGL